LDDVFAAGRAGTLLDEGRLWEELGAVGGPGFFAAGFFAPWCFSVARFCLDDFVVTVEDTLGSL
jgi:hypothetical protein